MPEVAILRCSLILSTFSAANYNEKRCLCLGITAIPCSPENSQALWGLLNPAIPNSQG